MVYRTPSDEAFDTLLGEWDFIVEVRSFRLDLTGGRGWREAFTQGLATRGFVLEKETGVISVKELERDAVALEPIGAYRLLEVSDVVVPEDAAPVECPLVLPPLGYVAVKLHQAAWEDTARELVTGLIKESMGRIFATERDWKQDRKLVGRSSTTPPIEIRRFEIVCTTSRSGEMRSGHELEIAPRADGWVYDFSGVDRLVNSVEVSLMWS